MVRDLLRGFVPADIVGDFDFASLEPFPTDYVGDGLRQSRSDRVWRVRFRVAGSQEWLYLCSCWSFSRRRTATCRSGFCPTRRKPG